MSKSNKKNANELPIFGKDIIDDWSWDCIEEKMREKFESDVDCILESKEIAKE